MDVIICSNEGVLIELSTVLSIWEIRYLKACVLLIVVFLHSKCHFYTCWLCIKYSASLFNFGWVISFLFHRYLDKRKRFEELKKRIAEIESNMATKTDLLKMIEEPLNKLGNSSPPSAMDIPDISIDTMVRSQWDKLYLLKMLPPPPPPYLGEK